MSVTMISIAHRLINNTQDLCLHEAYIRKSKHLKKILIFLKIKTMKTMVIKTMTFKKKGCYEKRVMIYILYTNSLSKKVTFKSEFQNMRSHYHVKAEGSFQTKALTLTEVLR